MEKYEDQLLHLKDQRCHLFSYGNSILCLVCKQTLLFSTGLNSTEELILDHLESSEHKECMRTLFKMCMPDQACDFDDRKYLDIATKSIFDISVLLGEESSYICQKDQLIVCLMCKSSISEIYSSFAHVKVEVTQHLDSAMHSNSVKEVCWFYRLNSKKDFLLFHKSILHCSICQETTKCQESELLHSAVGHLESYNHEVRCNIKQLHIATETIVKEESSINYCEEGYGLEVIDQKHELDDICELKPPLFIDTGSVKEESLRNHCEDDHRSDVNDPLSHPVQLDPLKLMCSIDENWIVKCEEQSKSLIEFGDSIDVVKTESNQSTYIENHCQVLDFSLSKQIKVRSDLMVCNNNSLEGQNGCAKSAKSRARKKCFPSNENGGLMETLQNTSPPIIKRNFKFLEFSNQRFVCTLCNEILCGLPKKREMLLKKLRTHFDGEIHKLRLEPVKTMNNMKACFQSDVINQNVQANDCSSTDLTVNSVTELAANAISAGKSTKNFKISTVRSNEGEIEDVDCHHKCKYNNKFLDKCIKCIKRMFRKARPELDRLYIRIKNKEFFCFICRCNLSSERGLKSQMISYFDHIKTEKHQKCESWHKRMGAENEKNKRNRQTKKQRRAIRQQTKRLKLGSILKS